MSEQFHEKEKVLAYHEGTHEYLKAVIVGIDEEKKMAYVHYHLLDKREERWINLNLIRKRKASRYAEGVEPPSINISSDQSDYSDDDYRSLFEINFSKRHRERQTIRNINKIIYGTTEINTWYFSPYPKQFYQDTIYICDHCASYFLTKEDLEQHIQENSEINPPGKEIYRKDNISIFEISGFSNKFTCQSLALLCKLFLYQKTIIYDIEGFIFYVLCEADETGAHIAAFFSRERESYAGNILSCIVTLPPYQKKGYGTQLISLAYEIARRSKRCGPPEHPLSHLGRLAFIRYWSNIMVITLYENKGKINDIKDIVVRTGIDMRDVIEALKSLNLIVSQDEETFVVPDWNTIEKSYTLIKQKGFDIIDTKMLIWDPTEEDI